MPAPISRRQMLQGAGAALALPWLEAMTTSRALAAGKPVAPRRMAIYSTAGGTVIESWKPKQQGQLDKLPSILRPLEAMKDKLLVVSGLGHHGRGSGLNAHEFCSFVHLTGANQVTKVDGRPQTSVSLDQMVADHVGGETFLPSMELATTPSQWKFSFRKSSASGRAQPPKTEPSSQSVPYETNPRIAFDRMFRGRSPLVPDWNKRAAARAKAIRQTNDTSDSIERSILDLVREDARRLRKKVGKADQQKMDQYLESVGSIQRRVALIEAQAAEMQRDGLGISAPVPEGLPANAKDWDPIQQVANNDPEVQAKYIDLMGDLLVLALQTDTTRVVTFAVGNDGSLFPGVVTVGFERHFHTLEHQGGNPDPRRSDPIAREACRQVSEWFVGNFARMVNKMQEIDEGGTSLLDNTLTLFTSYMADGGHHRQDYPCLLVGNAQGTLTTGRHVAFPHGTPVSNLYVEMLHRMGVRTSEFGESRTSPAAAYDGRLPGLLV